MSGRAGPALNTSGGWVEGLGHGQGCEVAAQGRQIIISNDITRGRNYCSVRVLPSMNMQGAHRLSSEVKYHAIVTWHGRALASHTSIMLLALVRCVLSGVLTCFPSGSQKRSQWGF